MPSAPRNLHGVCRFCGREAEGVAFEAWVKPTFTDHDKLLSGEVVCEACLFWFDEASVALAERLGRDRPQRMRNYSHFILEGQWLPLSKGDKPQMRALLTSAPFPELAVIADSGQKHLVFRALRNAPGSVSGWVQFEDWRVFVQPDQLKAYLTVLDALYEHFSKEEIASGRYSAHRIQLAGMARFLDLEQQARRWRGSPLFALALFLTQRSEADGRTETDGGDAADGDLAGHPVGLQEQSFNASIGTINLQAPPKAIGIAPTA